MLSVASFTYSVDAAVESLGAVTCADVTCQQRGRRVCRRVARARGK